MQCVRMDDAVVCSIRDRPARATRADLDNPNNPNKVTLIPRSCACSDLANFNQRMQKAVVCDDVSAVWDVQADRGKR